MVRFYSKDPKSFNLMRRCTFIFHHTIYQNAVIGRFSPVLYKLFYMAIPFLTNICEQSIDFMMVMPAIYGYHDFHAIYYKILLIFVKCSMIFVSN